MVLSLASLAGHGASSLGVVGSVVDQPLLVAAAGAVVVLAILLVFVMVLRSGGNKRSSIGIGYDGQQGPVGQPKAPPSQPGAYGGPRGAGQGWPQSNGYGATASPNGMGGNMGGTGGSGWGGPSYQNSWSDNQQPAQAYGGSQSPSWNAAPSAGQWQDQAAWGQQQASQPAMQGNWAPAAAQPSSQGGWSQQTDQGGYGGGWSAGGAGSAQPDYGGGQRGGGWTGGIAPSQDMGGYNPPAYGEVQRPPVARPGGADRGAVLIVRQSNGGKDIGRTYEVRKDRMTIGRNRESDIFLEDLAVSRTHASVGRDDRGRYIVRDEQSGNGTFVNNQRITEQTLEDGDEIQIGQTVLAFSRR